MAVRRDVVEERLAKIGQAVRVIEQALAAGPDLGADALRLYAAERALQVAIESVLDIGNHIIAAEGWPRPHAYSEVLRVLGERGVLPPDFARRIEGMAGLRNVLVHEYLAVDPDLLRQALHDAGDFGTFSEHILAYLRSRDAAGR